MGRWTEYYLDDDFNGFWGRRLRDPAVRVLAILGVGFDPRCLIATKALMTLEDGNRFGYLALKLIARPAFGASGNAMEVLTNANLNELTQLGGGHREAMYDVEIQDAEGHNVAGRKTLAAMSSTTSILEKYTDILVDISGMPRGVFFPLITYLLRHADKGTFRNLHVVVVEDPFLDSRIYGREYGQADYLHTFRYQGEDKLVWLPLVGTNEVTRLEKIYNKIKGSCIEICPILPFPAQSMRRVDDIAVKHADLFEGFLVSVDNLLLCNERNPFDIYRKILDVEDYYRSRFSTVAAIGKVTTIVSPLSGKTLSLGMLLAAIERSLPVCHVEAGTYQVDVDEKGSLVGNGPSRPTLFWLAGEPYIK